LALTRVGFDSVISGGVGLAESTGLVLVAVVVGSLIYSLHCAFLQCPISGLMMLFHESKHPDCNLLKRFKTVLKRWKIVFDYDLNIEKNYDRDYARWIRRCNYPNFQASFDKWASQAHFLYGCGWAIMVGAIIGRYLSHAVRGHGWQYFFFGVEGRVTFCLLLVLSVLSLFGALIQDYALYYYDKKLMTDFHSEPHKTKSTDDEA